MSYSEIAPRPDDGRSPDHAGVSPIAHASTQRAHVQALFARVRAIDIAEFEGRTDDATEQQLRARTLEALDAALLLLDELPEQSEPLAFPDEPPSGGFSIATGSGHEAGIADIAFIAQVELRHRVDRLRGLGGASPAVLLAECDGALRRIVRALVAIDRAIARGSSSDATSLDGSADLDLSLRIRRAYAVFRTRVLDLADVNGPVRLRLLAGGREIAVLVGLPFYALLRLADRVHLRSLQQRLVALLRAEELDELDGQRLWSDVVAFAAMLAQVNRRQELFEHDSRIVIEVVDSLSDLGLLSEPMARQLARLEGRDEDVDALLATGRRDLAAWAPVLTRVAQELGRSRTEGDL